MPEKQSWKTLVMKFGGTSVGSMEALTKVIQIVKDARAKYPRVVACLRIFKRSLETCQ